MPHDGPPIKTPESKSLTILLNGTDKIFYYHGTEFAANEHMYETSFDELKGLGRVIREKQLKLQNMHVEKAELFVLIKPGNETFYKDFIAVLDEMLINKVTRYAVTDLEKGEATYLDRHR